MICRNRAGSYAEGATRGAPEATHLADRWRMWRSPPLRGIRANPRMRPSLTFLSITATRASSEE